MVVWMSAWRSNRAISWIGICAWANQLAQVRRKSCGVQGGIPVRRTAAAKPFLILAMRSPCRVQNTHGEAGQCVARNRARDKIAPCAVWLSGTLPTFPFLRDVRLFRRSVPQTGGLTDRATGSRKCTRYAPKPFVPSGSSSANDPALGFFPNETALLIGQ